MSLRNMIRKSVGLQPGDSEVSQSMSVRSSVPDLEPEPRFPRRDNPLVIRSAGPTRMDALVERYAVAARNLAAHPRSEIFITGLLEVAAAILRSGNPLPADSTVMKFRSRGLVGSRAVMAGLVARALISRAGVVRLDAPRMVERRREDRLPEQIDPASDRNLGRNSRGYRVRDLVRSRMGLK